MTITVAVTASIGHRLPSYKGICASPHGHNARFEVEIETHDVFLDFKVVQKDLRSIIDLMDHAMILHTQDPLLPILQSMNMRTYPLEEEPTTEALAREVCAQMVKRSWDVVRVTVFETEKYSATLRRLDQSRSHTPLVDFAEAGLVDD